MSDSAETAPVRLPLTPADIFGVVTPGGTLLLVALAFDFLLAGANGAENHVRQPLLSFVRNVYQATVGHDAISQIIGGVVALACFYVVGNVIASISAICLDRILVYKGYGYPYAYLLKVDPEHRRSLLSTAFYRGMLFWVNSTLVVIYLALFVHTKARVGEAIAVTTDVIAWFLVFLCSLFVFTKIVAGSPWVRPKVRGRWVETYLVRAYCGLYEVIARMIAKLINTRVPFNDSFLTRYRVRFVEQFNTQPELAGTNNFWFCYCYVIERSIALRNVLSHAQTTCVFARNLATALYLAFLYCFGSLVLQKTRYSLDVTYIRVAVLLIPPVLLLSAFVMLLRFYHLFVSHFTKLVFRSFLALTETMVHSRNVALVSAPEGASAPE